LKTRSPTSPTPKALAISSDEYVCSSKTHARTHAPSALLPAPH
jgi:hypothetical protein